jgi:hypothetical protein
VIDAIGSDSNDNRGVKFSSMSIARHLELESESSPQLRSEIIVEITSRLVLGSIGVVQEHQVLLDYRSLSVSNSLGEVPSSSTPHTPHSTTGCPLLLSFPRYSEGSNNGIVERVSA